MPNEPTEPALGEWKRFRVINDRGEAEVSEGDELKVTVWGPTTVSVRQLPGGELQVELRYAWDGPDFDGPPPGEPW